MKRRVVVAMSGGVDSSVAAAILAEQGYDVIGIAMRLAAEGAAGGRRKACCSYEDFEDARRVAERMGFPFYVVDLREDFRTRVIDSFVDEYLAGRTPNPCLLCNRDIKFDRLWRRARALGAQFVATGHYARIERDFSGKRHLLRASDAEKDQSYFLFTLSQEQLARTLFPVGAMSKAEVRARAAALGLVNANKPESQEICFVTDGDYARFVSQHGGAGRVRTGLVTDDNGHELGRHAGIHRFTVGQRRGLGIATGEPLYVREISAADARVVVVPRHKLGAAGLRASRLSLVDPDLARAGTSEVEVKVRYRQRPIAALLKMLTGSRAEVRFSGEPIPVTPGQACVFYRGDEVIGGGIIDRPIPT